MTVDRQFQEPHSIADATARKRMLERDIMNIERQLAEPVRMEEGRPMAKKEYRYWRSKAHASLVFKKAEQAFLKDWIKERRRQIESGKIGIYKSDDSKELLLKTRQELKKLLDDADTDIPALYNAIDQFLQHVA